MLFLKLQVRSELKLKKESPCLNIILENKLHIVKTEKRVIQREPQAVEASNPL